VQLANLAQTKCCNRLLASNNFNILVFFQIDIFLRVNNFFQLPSDPTIPVIMVGPGTGVAPLLAFIQHRSVTQVSLLYLPLIIVVQL